MRLRGLGFDPEAESSLEKNDLEQKFLRNVRYPRGRSSSMRVVRSDA